MEKKTASQPEKGGAPCWAWSVPGLLWDVFVLWQFRAIKFDAAAVCLLVCLISSLIIVTWLLSSCQPPQREQMKRIKNKLGLTEWKRVKACYSKIYLLLKKRSYKTSLLSNSLGKEHLSCCWHASPLEWQKAGFGFIRQQLHINLRSPQVPPSWHAYWLL